MMMESKTIGGVTLPVLGLGTYGGPWGVTDGSTDEECEGAVKEALRLGYMHIDTAEYYGDGHAEELIGKAIKGFERSKLFLTSKVSGNHLRHDEVIQACEASLRRLGTSYFDLYLVHWWDDRAPIAETMQAMVELQRRGLIRHIGVSNFTREQLVAAQQVCSEKIVANQVEYNLERRDNGRHTTRVESDVIPYCVANDIFVIAYKPLALGSLLSDAVVKRLAQKYAKTPAQVLLNWLIAKPNVITIPRTTDAVHLVENRGCLGWTLRLDDGRRLDECRNL